VPPAAIASTARTAYAGQHDRRRSARRRGRDGRSPIRRHRRRHLLLPRGSRASRRLRRACRRACRARRPASHARRYDRTRSPTPSNNTNHLAWTAGSPPARTETSIARTARARRRVRAGWRAASQPQTYVRQRTHRRIGIIVQVRPSMSPQLRLGAVVCAGADVTRSGMGLRGKKMVAPRGHDGRRRIPTRWVYRSGRIRSDVPHGRRLGLTAVGKTIAC